MHISSPSHSTTIYLVRHGATPNNLEKVRRGAKTDEELSSEGLQQAQAVANWFSKQNLSEFTLYSSHKMRAFQTAEAIKTATGYTGEIIRNPDLQEQISGLEEDTLYEEADRMLAEWQENQKALGLQENDRSQFPGGESNKQTVTRMAKELVKIGMDHSKNFQMPAIVVTHAHALSLFAQERISPTFPRLKCGDVAKVAFDYTTNCFELTQYIPNADMQKSALLEESL